MGMTFRLAETGDIPIILAWLDCPQDREWAVGRATLTSADIEAWWTTPGQWGWILEMDQVPGGYGEVWADPDARDVEIAHVVVDPEARRQGYGRQLAEFLYGWAQNRWPWPVFMRVAPDNGAALRCYRRVHFLPVEPLTEDMDPRWIWLVRRPVPSKE